MQARACLAKAGKRHPAAKVETTAHGSVEPRTGIYSKIETDVRIFALSRELSPAAILKTVCAHAPRMSGHGCCWW